MTEIVLEGPAKNALGTKLLTAVRDQIRAASPSPLLLRGADGAFSAGWDANPGHSHSAGRRENTTRGDRR